MRNCEKCGHELPVTTTKDEKNITFKTEDGAMFWVQKGGPESGSEEGTLEFKFGTQVGYRLNAEQSTTLLEWMSHGKLKLVPLLPGESG